MGVAKRGRSGQAVVMVVIIIVGVKCVTSTTITSTKIRYVNKEVAVAM